MIARMHSVFGWMRRQLGHFGAAPARSRNRPVRVPSLDDALERRQVLSAASYTPFATYPGEFTALATTKSTPTPAPLSIPSAAAVPYPAYAFPQASVTPAVAIPTAAVGTVLPSPLAVSSSTSSAAAYVESLYQTVFDRNGSPAEVEAWVTRMGSGLSLEGVAEGFINSPEHRAEEVNSFYEEFLHRTAGPASSVWVNALLSGVSDQAVAEAILDSPEYQQAHQDPSLFVQDLYLDVLGRQADQTGLAAWESALASGESRQAVVASFVTSPEAVDRAVDGLYEQYLGTLPDAGNTRIWMDVLESPHGSISDVAEGILSSGAFVNLSTQA